MRWLRLTEPMLHGDDVRAVQRALGARADGWYGPLTAARVRVWKWKPGGYPRRRVNDRLGSRAQQWLLGLAPLPDRYRARAERRGPLEPRPILPTDPGHRSEFLVPDPEGALGRGARRYHAGKDWFASPGTDVASPVTGDVVEVLRRRRRTGQAFGGTVKVLGLLEGQVWVLRHVDPIRGLRVGDRVAAGDVLATVTFWGDGRPHVHVEVWKTLAGGYRIRNMIDPVRLIVP